MTAKRALAILLLLASCETIRRDSESAQNDRTDPALFASLAPGSRLDARYIHSGRRIEGRIATITGSTPLRTQRFGIWMERDTEIELVFYAEDRESGISAIEWHATIGFWCLNTQDSSRDPSWVTVPLNGSFPAPSLDEAPQQASTAMRIGKLPDVTQAGCGAQARAPENHFEVNFSVRAVNNSPRRASSELSGDFQDLTGRNIP